MKRVLLAGFLVGLASPWITAGCDSDDCPPHELRPGRYEIVSAKRYSDAPMTSGTLRFDDSAGLVTITYGDPAVTVRLKAGPIRSSHFGFDTDDDGEGGSGATLSTGDAGAGDHAGAGGTGS